MPRDEQGSASTAPFSPTRPVEADLAAYRSRLDEKLAARREGQRRGVALGAAGRAPAGGPGTRAAASPSRLVAIGLFAVLAAAAVAGAAMLVWPLLPDRPALVEARQALALERTRSQQLAAELMATARALKAQAMAMADHDALEAQIETLREELRQAGEIAAMRDHFLAQAQDRLRQLQAPPDTTLATAAMPVVLPLAQPAIPPVNLPVTLPVTPPATQPVAAPGDLPKLMARARLLLGQGDIGGARTVLERAASSGNALALFALAETYDPAILSTWGTHGTRGDVARAHALYEQAYAAGVAAAADRLAVLR